MSVKKAEEHFKGEGGMKRLSCAHAIAEAFKYKFRVTDEMISVLTSASGGRAPENMCGALYAVKLLMEKNGRTGFENVRSAFISEAGSDKCKDIRAFEKMSCIGCVRKAAQLLEIRSDNG